jgi:predicted HicB family RNase H-like nuclease
VRTNYNERKVSRMGQKYCKKINLEIPHELHAEIKKQAIDRNITMRTLILRYLLPSLDKNRNVR